MTDADIISIYTDELIALSETARTPVRLKHTHASAHAVSPICGSEVTLDVCIDAQGRVTDIGYQIDACALVRAATALIRDTAPGHTRAEIKTAATTLAHTLAGQDASFPDPWHKLSLFIPVKEYPARHNALMLPFVAIDQAFDKISETD